MAGLSALALIRDQFAAIRWLRWRLFLNSLRGVRGSLELMSRIAIAIFVTLGGLGGAFGFGATAYVFLSQHQPGWIALLLWSVFVFWQAFPIMTTAFSENLDSSHLLRFPLAYQSYFLARLTYGTLDTTTALGGLWLLGMVIGIGWAAPHLLPWTTLVLSIFALVNIVLARLVFAWAERWLAQRRTREIMGVVIILLVLSVQLLGPILGHYGRAPREGRVALELSPQQRLLPPGLAAQAITQHFRGRYPAAWGELVLLSAYGGLFLGVLHLRLRTQYRGESLTESPTGHAQPLPRYKVRPAWNLVGLAPPVAAVLEKELRYLARSGPMLFTLIMPPLMLLVFRWGPSGKNDGLLNRAPNFVFPIAAAYVLLLLTNLIYNNFGSDGAGIQFFFAAPVRFRDIVLGKNLAHALVLMMEMLLVGGAVSLIFRPPPIDVTLATLTGILYAAPINFAVGNLLSMYSPKKIEFAILGRQRASQLTVLSSFAVQLGVFGLGAIVIFLSRQLGNLWLATLIFLILALAALAGYSLVLRYIDEVALARRDAILSELSRS